MPRFSRKSVRLDLKAFQRQKRSGLVLIVVILIAATIAFGLVAYMGDVSHLYFEVEGKAIPNLATLQKLISSSKKPVAVMFESPTCPVCKRMYPYWAKLEERSPTLPVSFYHILYGPQTASAFQKYHVYDTPTFIVFVNGKPVARHVGAFISGNITDSMLAWAIGASGLPQVMNSTELARQGLSIFNEKCAACHGIIPGIDKKSILLWLRGRKVMNDPLASVFYEALKRNMTLEEYFGGYTNLRDTVATMRKYTELTAYELSRTTYLLSYMSHILLGLKPPVFNLSNVATLFNSTSPKEALPLRSKEAGLAGQAASIISAVAAFVAGFVAAFSPCVLPLLVTQAATISATGRKLSASNCGLCGFASFLGVIAIGLLFVIAGVLATSIQEVLLPVMALAIIAAGTASLLGVPVELDTMLSTKHGGLYGFCAAYGFLAVQCSLPLVVGSLLLVLSAGAGISGILVAASFALGVSLPLAIVLYAVSRLGAGVVNKIMQHKRALDIMGGLVLLGSGLYLLLYSLGFV